MKLSERIFKGIRWIVPFSGIILAVLVVEVHAWGTIAFTDEQGNGVLTQDDFRSLSRELGLAFSSIPLAPAEPLGLLGFDIGIAISVADIRDEEGFWHNAIDNRDPIPILVLPQILLRKGVPGGIETSAVSI